MIAQYRAQTPAGFAGTIFGQNEYIGLVCSERLSDFHQPRAATGSDVPGYEAHGKGSLS
jgi:hypothetical protein